MISSKRMVGLMNQRAVVSLTWCAAAITIGAASPSAWPHEHSPHGAQTSALAAAEPATAGAAVSFVDLQATVDALNRARAATAKYQDVRTAKVDGYRAIGPYVRGMGFHYVNLRAARGAFDVERPPILLYEGNESGPEGLRLVGVSYLLAAPTGLNGQPVDSPFPRALAVWHKHNDICLLGDNTVRMKVSQVDCQQQGGRFIAETDWMVHAWIWQDSPAGVFGPTNPDVQ
jgi:hypothetical protein